MKTLYSVLAAVFFCSATGAFAEIYRWVDSQGRVQYSDQPPPESNAKKVTPKPASGAQGSAGTKSYQDQDQEFRKRRVEEGETAKKQATEEQNKKTAQKNCTDAKSQLASLQAGGRFVKANEKGEKEVLDDKGMEAAIADARKAVAEWCK